MAKKYLQMKKTSNEQKILKAMDNKICEIETYIEKLKKIENVIKNKKPFLELIIISKNEMDKFEKEELKKRNKNCKIQLVWLVSFVN